MPTPQLSSSGTTSKNTTAPSRPLPPPPQPHGPQLPPQPTGLAVPPRRSHRRRWLFGSVAALLIMLVTAGGMGFLWYQQALTPRDMAKTGKTRVVIEEGSSVASIADILAREGIIRSALAFQIYARDKTNLQAGGYALSPAMTVAEIVDHLEKGTFDEFSITILPGYNIWDIKDNLVQSGFSQQEVDDALAASYDHPVLAGRPSGASLEGYIFPDTYRLLGDASVEDLLMKAFDALQQRIIASDLEAKLAERKLTLYQGITLASIIQKEVANTDDERQVAQIFHKRLAEGISLGADATFIYGAQLLGVEPRVTLDSPYNTRQHTGLPPGPISNPAFSALEAVAHPTSGDFLFFVSGDDGITYFTRTLEEHVAATRQHCRQNCDVFEN